MWQKRLSEKVYEKYWEGNMDIVQNMLPDSTLEYLKLKQTED